MADVLREFLVRLGLDVDEKTWKAADQLVGKLAKGLAKGLAVAFSAVAGVATGAAVALGRWVTQIAGAADDAAKAAQQIGLTTEEVQELTYAANLAGAEMSDIKTSFRRLGKNAYDVATKGTGPAADAFKKLGVNAKDSKGEIRGQMELFEEIADKLAKTENETLKVALANDLFGRSGAKLLPLLNEGAEGLRALREEARELGFVLSSEDAAAMEQFNDDLERLKRSWAGFKTQIVVALMPALQGLVNRSLDWLKANRALIRSRIEAWIEKVRKIARRLRLEFIELDKIVKEKFGGWEPVLRAIASVFVAGGLLAGFFKLRATLLLIVPVAKTLMAIGAIAFIKIIAIVAIVTALALGIDDLITGLQGGESYTKDFLDAWRGQEGIFGSIARGLESTWELAKSVANFLSTAVPLAFNVIWTIAGPIIDKLVEGVTMIAGLIADFLGVELDETALKFENWADTLDAITAALKVGEGAIMGWAGTVRDSVQGVIDRVQVLVDKIRSLPLGKLALEGSRAANAASVAGLFPALGQLALTQSAQRATNLVFGDTNVSTQVAQSGATADQIASANAREVTKAQRKNLQLAYARIEGGER